MIGIFGGTFDPVHFGHLRCALEVHQALDLTELRFIPACRPPHRGAPVAAAEHRLAMLRLAIADQPGFRIDERELRRSGPSYTVDTLSALRAELPQASLCLIVGQDAFLELHTWNRWERLIELAHIVVAARPGAAWEPAPPVAALCARRLVEDRAALRRAPAGAVLRQPITQLDISATHVRRLIAAGVSARYLSPDPVLDYIVDKAIYRDPS